MSAFEDFVKTELPVRPVVQTNENEETLLVRRGIIPRQYVVLDINEGQVIGKEGGVIKGVDGGTGGTGTNYTLIELNSGEDIGGHRVVISKDGDAFYSDPSVEVDGGKVVGISTVSSVLDDPCFVQTAGLLEDVMWTWNEGPVYNGSTGVLTQTAPLTGFVLQVGVALSPTSILINIQQSIIRS